MKTLPRIGLYYPYIHFRNEAWLKLGALYWSKMGRIVPPQYEVHDSPTVQVLKESGFVTNLDPASGAWQVAPLFLDLLKQHGKDLSKRYDPRRQADVAAPEPNPHATLPGRDPRLAYVAVDKVHPEVQQALVDTHLVVKAATFRGSRWLGMHPRLAAVYMTALANQLASGGLEPVTDAELDHVAISGWTMPRLAQALLEDMQLVGPTPAKDELQDQLGMIAIRAVAPKNIGQVPVEKIVEIRDRNEDELIAFRAHLEELGENLKASGTGEDPGALQVKLEAYYEETLKRDLEHLKEGLTSAGVDTTVTALNTQLEVPAALTSSAVLLQASVDPVVGGTAAVAFGAMKVWRARREKQQQFRSSPAAYLLRLEEGLQPATLLERVRRQARMFLAGY